ncbi:MAG: hypothetical protein RLY43_394 [Bacteroidota bacterium]
MVDVHSNAATNALNSIDNDVYFYNSIGWQLFEKQFDCKIICIPAKQGSKCLIEFNNPADETAFILRFS